MRFPRLITLLLALSIAAFGITACGDDDDDGGGGGGGNTTSESGGGGGSGVIYSSLPLQGAQRLQTTAMVKGIQLALKQAGNKAGNVTVSYKSLDDSTAQAGNWTPEATSANARKVAQDDKAIAYIGEFNSGASAISMPILNEASPPVPQISPSNTAVGLTSDEPGAEPGEPDKYYPSGDRHYLRIVPKDTIQGAALATIMKEDGCTNAAIANDKEVYGAGLAKNVAGSLEEQGVKLAFNEGIDPKASNFRSLAARAKTANVDCFVFSGTTPNGGVQIMKDFSAAIPSAKLYGPDGVSNAEFFDPKEGGVPAGVAKKVKITVATLDPDQYPPEGQEFFEQYKSEYGVKNVDVYAIYGYEAANLVLDAIERSGSTDRSEVLKALFDTKDRKSVLGNYSIDENGDTTITDYGVYTIEDGALKFDKTVKAQGS